MVVREPADSMNCLLFQAFLGTTRVWRFTLTFAECWSTTHRSCPGKEMEAGTLTAGGGPELKPSAYSYEENEQ